MFRKPWNKVLLAYDVCFIVPVCCEAETLLRLWLGQVPEWSVMFLRFAMFESLAVSSGQNLLRLIQADGHVKNIQSMLLLPQV